MQQMQLLDDEELKFEDDNLDDDAINSESAVTVDDIPKEERKLRTQAYDKSVSDVVSMIDDGDIILNPEYQRNYVWDNKRASLLVESILLNVPIPVIYVAEDEDSIWSVVDGLQRLNTLRRFFSNEFKLRGLEVLQELNGSQYSTLNPKAKRILKNGNLRIIVIYHESHPEIKYEIFMRLNRGSIRLNEQELRNCLYRGSLNELLMRLRENIKFLEMIGLREPHKRMTDAELILRYFTLSEAYDARKEILQSSYTGKVRSSLNKYMEQYKNAPKNIIENLENKFEATVDKVYSVFGDKAFQRINPDGTFDRSRLNRAIMDIIMLSFEHSNKANLVEHKEDIHNLLLKLPLDDQKFYEAITIGTSDRKQVEYRLFTWNKKLNELLV